MVNLDLYKVFYTVAKCGSLTKAAEELYISQPAVSRSIKQLELQLGVTLFTRKHQGMVLSSQGGKVIFAEVERALQLLKNAEDRIAEMKNLATGTIRIGASDTIFEYFLADKIVEFHKNFPGVKMELLADITPVSIEKLKADECDVAFVNLPIAPDPELQLFGNFMRQNDIFVAGEKFAELKDKQVDIATLQNNPLVLMQKGTVARGSLDNFFSSLGVELEPSVEVGSWDLMKRFIASGMGIGVIPREYAMKALEDGSMFELQTDVKLPARSVGMLLPRQTPISYALHCFIEQFQKND